jgi:hypothetical protein
MARKTLNERINLLAGFTTSLGDSSQYIRDGLADVVRHVMKHNGSQVDQFCVTKEFTNSPFVISSSTIISLKRKVGTFIDDAGTTVDDYRPATKSALIGFERTKDPDSLLYQSKYNPVYVINKDYDDISSGMSVNVSPPASSANPVKVTYVDMNPKGSVVGDTYSELNTEQDKYLNSVSDYYLHTILLYAASKHIQKRINSLVLDDEDPELAKTLEKRYEEVIAEYKMNLGFGDPQPQQPQQTRGR